MSNTHKFQHFDNSTTSKSTKCPTIKALRYLSCHKYTKIITLLLVRVYVEFLSIGFEKFDQKGVKDMFLRFFLNIELPL